MLWKSEWQRVTGRVRVPATWHTGKSNKLPLFYSDIMAREHSGGLFTTDPASLFLSPPIYLVVSCHRIYDHVGRHGLTYIVVVSICSQDSRKIGR